MRLFRVTATTTIGNVTFQADTVLDDAVWPIDQLVAAGLPLSGPWLDRSSRSVSPTMADAEQATGGLPPAVTIDVRDDSGWGS